MKIEGPGGLDLAPALDFSTKDAIREGRDTKGVCVGEVEGLSRERSPIVRFSPLRVLILVGECGVGMRRGVVIASSGLGLLFEAKPKVFPPPISPRDSTGSHSPTVTYLITGDGPTNAHP